MIIITSKDASPSFTFGECSLGQEELMSSGGYQWSSGVSNLNHNTLPMAVRQWWPNHCPSHPPGFQLCSSLLLHNQQEALSAASPILRAAVFLSLPVIPMAVSILHTDWAGNPLQPTPTGNSHAQGRHTKFWALGTRIHCGPPMNVNYWKIADIQAHSAAPSAALRACRSAIFFKSWKCVQVFQYLGPILWMNYKPLNQWFSQTCSSQGPAKMTFGLRPPSQNMFFHGESPSPRVAYIWVTDPSSENSRSTSSQRGTECRAASL